MIPVELSNMLSNVNQHRKFKMVQVVVVVVVAEPEVIISQRI
jgi:hypothetical protein